MGKYTLNGSKELEQKIDQDLSAIQTELWSMPEAKNWDTLILGGGYGRGEGTVLKKEDQELPYNDYDLILVSKTKMNPVERKCTQKKLQDIEVNLSKKLNLPVDIFLHTPTTLKNAETSLMNYELKQGHYVVCGDQNIGKKLPAYSLKELPLMEGTRLLINRGTLLLMNELALHRFSSWNKNDGEQFHRYIVKTHLAMGDALLIALGLYDVSYQKKKEMIKKVNPKMVCDCPDIKWIIEKYLQAIKFKEVVEYEEMVKSANIDLFQETIGVYSRFFSWYESKRLKCDLNVVKTVEGYIGALLSDKGNHKVENVLRNIYYKNSIPFLFRWCFIHPRVRLYPVLFALLKDKNEEINAVGRLIGCYGYGGGKDPVVYKYLNLWKTFS